MYRNIISIILTTCFLVFLTAPTIIILIDDSANISMFYTTSEEEEKAPEKLKNKNLVFQENLKSLSELDLNESDLDLEYRFKNYSNPYLNLISPPPDSYIL